MTNATAHSADGNSKVINLKKKFQRLSLNRYIAAIRTILFIMIVKKKKRKRL